MVALLTRLGVAGAARSSAPSACCSTPFSSQWAGAGFDKEKLGDTLGNALGGLFTELPGAAAQNFLEGIAGEHNTGLEGACAAAPPPHGCRAHQQPRPHPPSPRRSAYCPRPRRARPPHRRAGLDSDIDLLLVSNSTPNTIDELARLRRSLRRLGFPFDPFIIDTARFEESKDVFGGIAYFAQEYGRVIFESAGRDAVLTRLSSGPDPQPPPNCGDSH